MKLLLFLVLVFIKNTEASWLNNSDVIVIENVQRKSNFIDPFANQTAPPCSEIKSAGVRNGLTDRRAKWERFLIYMDPAYDNREQDSIIEALNTLKKAVPCLDISYVNSGARPPVGQDYVYVVKGSNNGCNSHVGRLRRGRQDLNLQSPRCLSQGTILHEMIHALGFHHEQCRTDRDAYVTINFGNIIQGMEYAFQKVSGSGWNNFGVPYNQRSIMHYGSHAFSKNGHPTITAKNGQPFGRTDKLEQTDIQRLRNMYGCRN